MNTTTKLVVIIEPSANKHLPNPYTLGEVVNLLNSKENHGYIKIFRPKTGSTEIMSEKYFDYPEKVGGNCKKNFLVKVNENGKFEKIQYVGIDNEKLIREFISDKLGGCFKIIEHKSK